MSKTALITGATGGLGEVFAEAVRRAVRAAINREGGPGGG